MKLNQTLPLIPLAAFAPPLVIGAAIGLGLIWLLSQDDKQGKAPIAIDESPNPAPVNGAVSKSNPPFQPPAKRITREDLAEALAYGGRELSRKEAVDALEALGFRKSAAYKALSPDGKFGGLLDYTADGLVEWKG